MRPDFLPIGVAVEKQPRGNQEQVSAASFCDKSIDLTSELRDVTHVAAQENGICYNADIDTYRHNGRTYVVQGGGWDAAWTHTDVTDPFNPVLIYQALWDVRSYTPDIKTFFQGGQPYIAISMERFSSNGYCGVAIYNVSNPAIPQLQSHIDGTDWCDVHNIFVEDDANGEGAYIYLTADATHDMRVLDIGGQQGGSVTAPLEIGRYRLPGSTYIHDITVLDHTEASGGAIGRRVYIAYWERGLVVLDAQDVTPGVDPTPIINGGVIRPPGFQVHHVMASPDGSRVFIQDEMFVAPGAQPVQMWDVSNPQAPTFVDSLIIGKDVPVSAAHNLEMRWDLHPDRLYVGWYKMGLQAWQYTNAGFVRSNPEPRTALLYHQVQTNLEGTAFTGAWGVRLAEIDGGLYIFQSDYRYGLVIDCLVCPVLPTPSATETPLPVPTDTPVPPATATSAAPHTALPQNTVAPTVTPTAQAQQSPAPTQTPDNPATATALPEGTVAPTVVPSATSGGPAAPPTATPVVEPPAPTAPATEPTAPADATPTATLIAPTAQTLTAQQVYNIQTDADANFAISPGDTLLYSVKIQNIMDRAATNVRFHQHLGDYLLLVSGSVRVNDGRRAASAIMTWGNANKTQFVVDIGTLEPDQTVEVNYAVVVSEAIPLHVDTIELQGLVSADGEIQAMVDNGMTDAVNDAPVLRIVRTVFRTLLPLIKR